MNWIARPWKPGSPDLGRGDRRLGDRLRGTPEPVDFFMDTDSVLEAADRPLLQEGDFVVEVACFVTGLL